MTKLLCILPLSFLPLALLAETDHVDIEKIAIEHARVLSIEAIEKNVYGFDTVGKLDFSRAKVLAGIDGNDRRFFFVSFPSIEFETKGHFVVLEICGHEVGKIQHSFSGFTSELELQAKNFEAMRGNRTADYPGGCDKD